VIKYSIILPVYNGGEYVKECVDSILSQTYSNFNLIVLDNCSNDGTKEWVMSLKDKRIEILSSGKLLTIEENWSRIKNIRKNEFITLIGHDDILAPDYLQTIDKLILQYPDASLYQTHFTYIDSKGITLRVCKPMQAMETASDFLKNFLTNSVDIMGTGFMMRSKDYDSLGGIPVSYPNLLFADMELWYRLTKISYKATAIEGCFSYRIHQSITKTTSDEKLLIAFEKIIFFFKTLKDEDKQAAGIIEEYGINFIHHYCKSLSHRLLRTPKSHRNGASVAELITKCKSYADLLVPASNYKPGADVKVRLAKCIDSNQVLRGMFLLFRKLYSMPVYN
jgi:glycosyltransferase involved in cell wall biosynthesis